MNLPQACCILVRFLFWGRSANNVHPFTVHRKALFLLLGRRAIARSLLLPK
jgi:hypothetical protein